MPAIVDTESLVAIFDRAERHYRWATAHSEKLEAPLLVCEPLPLDPSYASSNGLMIVRRSIIWPCWRSSE
jgi:hypothetical protein